MKLSIIIPVLNSHEVVRRQMMHYGQMPLPPDVEVILVDDGSEPPIPWSTYQQINILRTNDTRPWTQPKARNVGARAALGEFLLFTDIDHIVPEESVDWCRTCQYDFSKFRRYLGVLDERGRITQDRETLKQYGLDMKRGLRVSCHTLSMVIRQEVFAQTGGYREKFGKHPTHDDGHMKKMLGRRVRRGEITRCPDGHGEDYRPVIYVFPNGRFGGNENYNPMGLFHTLQR